MYSSTHDKPEPGERIGLLAGAGRFPVEFAKAARAQGYSVFAVGVAGMASDELADHCDDFVTAPIGRVGKTIRLFRQAGVSRAVMAGKIDKTILFRKRWWFWQLLPDWRALHMYFNYCRENNADDTMLLAVIREFGRDGIVFESALNYAPELLVRHGFLTKKKPSPSQWKDIRFGWELAKKIGELDIGQTVVVSDMAVMAVEAIEGTDAAIHRAGTLCRKGGFTVVKVEKPQQDDRFDVPTIGADTIKTMSEAGGRVLAVECGKTILLDEAEVVAMANRFGIAIVSISAEELALRVAG